LDEYVCRIKYAISTPSPLSIESLLNIIPDLYNDKIDYDLKHEMDDFKMTFDEYFIKCMNEKFKLKRITRKNCEDTIAAVLKYSNEDKRVDLFRRFLGIGEGKLRLELLDLFFVLIKSKRN